MDLILGIKTSMDITMGSVHHHSQLTDDQFIGQLIDTTLDPALFNHEAHLRLAWYCINRYGIEEAINQVTAYLSAYVAALGATDKYNTTLTIAAVKAVYHFMQKSAFKNFSDFIASNPRLNTEFKSLLSSHYSTDIYNNPEAKVKFLEPELLPFDI